MRKIFLGIAGSCLALVLSASSASAMMMKPVSYDGWITTSWSVRGGGCWINYTDGTAKTWNHKTVSACDNGMQKIGGLVKGRWYKYTVTKDGSTWTKVMKVKAM